MKKIKREIKFYKQNFHSIYKDHSLRIICKNYLIHIESMIRNHGVDKTILFHKEVLRFIQQSCMNQSATLSQDLFWTKTKNGWPKFLIKNVRKPIPELMDDLRFKQGLLTICNFYKILKAPVSYSISTVIEKNPESHKDEYWQLIDDISDHFKNFLKVRSIDVFSKLSTSPIFATSKAGANGPNAMGETSINDAIASVKDKIYLYQFKIAWLVFTPKAFKNWKRLFHRSLSLGDQNQCTINSRLHFLQEGGGKTRVICIPDIWSQTVLKPIHDFLMETLKRFPCDGTFSHPLIAKRVRKHTKTKPLVCYDLKAATDRMPIDLQERILGLLLGKHLASLWRNLLTDRDVSCRGQMIRYAVGQPMGILSSWAAMAITHHAIINYAKKDKSFYAVIGDDVAIASEKGAKEYERILGVLGMEISYEKSISSTPNNNLGEIAKRLFIDGGEISPIPPDILIKSTGNLIGFMEFIRVFSEKFHHSDPGGVSDSEYQQILSNLFHNSNFSEDDDAHVLLSCPILDNFPILPTIPPIKGVKNVWRTDLPKMRILRDFEQFFLELANNRTNQKIMSLTLDPKVFVEPSQKREFPLYQEFRRLNKEKLELLIKRINTTYIDEEADSFAEGPIKDLRDIFSFPNPVNQGLSKIYLEKRKIRLKNTHSMIQLFLDKKPFYRFPSKKR
jgi:hypothetical protein